MRKNLTNIVILLVTESTRFILEINVMSFEEIN